MKIIQFQGKNLSVTSNTVEGMFRQLTGQEEDEFLAWAKELPKDQVIKSVWHPIVQDWLFISGHGFEGIEEGMKPLKGDV